MCMAKKEDAKTLTSKKNPKPEKTQNALMSSALSRLATVVQILICENLALVDYLQLLLVSHCFSSLMRPRSSTDTLIGRYTPKHLRRWTGKLEVPYLHLGYGFDRSPEMRTVPFSRVFLDGLFREIVKAEMWIVHVEEAQQRRRTSIVENLGEDAIPTSTLCISGSIALPNSYAAPVPVGFKGLLVTLDIGVLDDIKIFANVSARWHICSTNSFVPLFRMNYNEDPPGIGKQTLILQDSATVKEIIHSWRQDVLRCKVLTLLALDGQTEFVVWKLLGKRFGTVRKLILPAHDQISEETLRECRRLVKNVQVLDLEPLKKRVQAIITAAQRYNFI